MRYILLAGEPYYHAAWGDFAGIFSSLELAKRAGEAKILQDCGFASILDLSTEEVHTYNETRKNEWNIEEDLAGRYK